MARISAYLRPTYHAAMPTPMIIEPSIRGPVCVAGLAYSYIGPGPERAMQHSTAVSESTYVHPLMSPTKCSQVCEGGLSCVQKS